MERGLTIEDGKLEFSRDIRVKKTVGYRSILTFLY